MAWRNWSVIVILILMNYIVFSLLGTLIFTSPPESGLIRTPQPTFTPGVGARTRVTLTYDFLTPTVAGTPATRSLTPSAQTTLSSATLLAPTLALPRQ